MSLKGEFHENKKMYEFKEIKNIEKAPNIEQTERMTPEKAILCIIQRHLFIH